LRGGGREHQRQKRADRPDEKVAGVDQNELGLGPSEIDGTFDDVPSGERGIMGRLCCRSLVEHPARWCTNRTGAVRGAWSAACKGAQQNPG